MESLWHGDVSPQKCSIQPIEAIVKKWNAYAASLGIMVLACQGCEHNRAALDRPAVVTSSESAPTTSTAAFPYRMTDCHLHLVDFLQRTDGARAALKAMDKCGVEEAIVSGMPVVKEWPQQEKSRPEYYLDDDSRCYWYSATDVLVARQVQSLSPQEQRRFHPTICGFNAPT